MRKYSEKSSEQAVNTRRGQNLNPGMVRAMLMGLGDKDENGNTVMRDSLSIELYQQPGL